MGISDQIDSDLKAAMRARDELRLLILRTLKSDFKYRKIQLGRELSDDDIIAVLGSAAKSRRESIEEYNRGGRQDLVEKEKAELSIVEQYLPQQLSPDELNGLIDKAIAESGATTIRDLGIVMKALMPELRGRADGKVVNAAVKARLEAK
jgi:uncharacterized protein